MSSTFSKVKSFDPNIIDSKPLVYDTKKVRSGPGAFGEFMERESQVFIENTKLKHDLEEAQAADVVMLLDPKKVKPSKFANRLEINFHGDEFEELKQSIIQNGCNAQAIKVRPIAGSENDEYEIVYGHRRHRACLEADKLVSVVVAKNMSDKQLFCEMERENQFRKNISAYEQGIIYKKVMDVGMYESAAALAKDVEVAKSSVSRALALINFPHEVISAFYNPTEIQFRWVDGLKKSLETNSMKVIEEAKMVTTEIIKQPANVVFFRLTHAVSAKPKPKDKLLKVGIKLFHDNRSVRVSLDNLPENESKREAFMEKLQLFLKGLEND